MRKASKAASISQEMASERSVKDALLFALLFGAATVLTLNPDWFDRPAAVAINTLTTGPPIVNRLAFALSYPAVQGVAVVALIWYCWFSISDQSRARLTSGIGAAVAAALVANLIKDALPTSPRPVVDPILKLHLASELGDLEGLQAIFLPGAHRFPSERATLFSGLAVAILLVRRNAGFIALAGTLLAEGSRLYFGLHFPTDFLGSFCLAATFVCLAQMRWAARLGRFIASLEATSAPIFYAGAFTTSYLLATAFDDVRTLIALLLH